MMIYCGLKCVRTLAISAPSCPGRAHEWCRVHGTVWRSATPSRAASRTLTSESAPKSGCEMRCCAAAAFCSTSERSCKCTEGISLNWVFLCTLSQISLPRSQVYCPGPGPIVRPCGVATTWLVFTGLNIGHCCRTGGCTITTATTTDVADLLRVGREEGKCTQQLNSANGR